MSKTIIAVVITYSFDDDTPVYLFDTEKEAGDFIREDYESEVRLHEEGGPELLSHYIDDDAISAELRYKDGDTVNWCLTYATDKRKEEKDHE